MNGISFDLELFYIKKLEKSAVTLESVVRLFRLLNEQDPDIRSNLQMSNIQL